MDDRLAAAISQWAPRFTTNGVTAGLRPDRQQHLVMGSVVLGLVRGRC
jgi:hypothetical protein